VAIAKKLPVRRKFLTIRYVREYELHVPVDKMPKPIKRYRTHPAIMGCGGDGKPDAVIDDGRVMEYVGIGWVCVKECADVEDYQKFPRVVD